MIFVAADVIDPIGGSHTHSEDRPPQRCTSGHWLLPGRMIVYAIACSCGEHLTWECECSAITYGPALAEGCSLLDGPARGAVSSPPITIYRLGGLHCSLGVRARAESPIWVSKRIEAQKDSRMSVSLLLEMAVSSNPDRTAVVSGDCG